MATSHAFLVATGVRLSGDALVGLCPPQHLHLISPDELVKALAERGLCTVKVEFGRRTSSATRPARSTT